MFGWVSSLGVVATTLMVEDDQYCPTGNLVSTSLNTFSILFYAKSSTLYEKYILI